MSDRMLIDEELVSNALAPSPSPTQSRVEQLSRALIRTDAARVFADNIEQVYGFWVELLLGIAVPGDIAEARSSTVPAFRFLDHIINTKSRPQQLSRLGHIALTIMLDRLKGAIGVSRRQGKLRSSSGRRNASLAMDLYLDAQGPISNRAQAKKQLNRRMQTSRRWTELGGCCPLLMVIYSDAAERLMSVQTFRSSSNVWPIYLTSFSADRSVSSMLLRAVSGHVLKSISLDLVEASNRLRLVAEAAVQHGTSQAHETQKHVIEIKRNLSTMY